VTFNDVSGGAFHIPAGSNGTEITLDDAASMGVDSNNECKGQTFTIEVEMTGHSVASQN
jgi:hypothetical protein